MDALAKRVEAAGEYMTGLILEDFQNYQKGEWLGLVRARARELNVAE